MLRSRRPSPAAGPVLGYHAPVSSAIPPTNGPSPRTGAPALGTIDRIDF